VVGEGRPRAERHAPPAGEPVHAQDVHVGVDRVGRAVRVLLGSPVAAHHVEPVLAERAGGDQESAKCEQPADLASVTSPPRRAA
jgi:hypothetical protein